MGNNEKLDYGWSVPPHQKECHLSAIAQINIHRDRYSVIICIIHYETSQWIKKKTTMHMSLFWRYQGWDQFNWIGSSVKDAIQMRSTAAWQLNLLSWSIALFFHPSCPRIYKTGTPTPIAEYQGYTGVEHATWELTNPCAGVAPNGWTSCYESFAPIKCKATEPTPICQMVGALFTWQWVHLNSSLLPAKRIFYPCVLM